MSMWRSIVRQSARRAYGKKAGNELLKLAHGRKRKQVR